MSTKAQTKANQQNAQKSTGPKTDEGKAVASKNAVKHGLFAAEAVVKGENPAEYEAYHDQFLAEWAPVGMVESLMAERVISLAWRLRRAERMQNQAIDEQIEHYITNPLRRRSRMLMCQAQGIPPDDPRRSTDHLQLGRMATYDWSDSKVLDRMLMYERRIESSLNKTIHNLKKYQLMRHIQVTETRKEQAQAQAFREAYDFEDTSGYMPAEKKGNSKKRTQSGPGLNGVTTYVEGDYDNMPAGGIEENEPNSNPNKANQSQLSESVLTKVAGKRKKSVRAATG
jgi:hypothetical protein